MHSHISKYMNGYIHMVSPSSARHEAPKSMSHVHPWVGTEQTNS